MVYGRIGSGPSVKVVELSTFIFSIRIDWEGGCSWAKKSVCITVWYLKALWDYHVLG